MLLFLVAIGMLIALAQSSYVQGKDVASMARKRFVLREQLTADALLLQAVLQTQLQARALLLTGATANGVALEESVALSRDRLARLFSPVPETLDRTGTPVPEATRQAAQQVCDALQVAAHLLGAWRAGKPVAALTVWREAEAADQTAALVATLEQLRFCRRDQAQHRRPPVRPGRSCTLFRLNKRIVDGA